MWSAFLGRVVSFCCRDALVVVVLLLCVGAGAGFYVARNFAMDSSSEDLISPEVSWRQDEAKFDAAFPQRNNLTLIVVDGVTPERTEEGARALVMALRARKALFPVVRDEQDSSFFRRNGLLFLSLDDVRMTTAKMIDAQPFLGPLAVDPSLRGVMDSLTAAMQGVDNGQTKLGDMLTPLTAIADALEAVVQGRPGFLSWQTMITGKSADTSQTRRVIEVQTALDYGALSAGGKAADTIRALAKNLGLTPAQGVRVRLTGPVPLADEEFATIADRAGLMSVLMSLAILLMLWLAVRSVRITLCILITLCTGLVLTTALGIAVIGSFNVISVAFVPLFVGLGVDFGIQFSVRYRAERHRTRELDLALTRAATGIGASLTLAAVAVAVCFYSFMPTYYSGLAELGFIAGSGMIIAFALSLTLLPALIHLMRPRGEDLEIGYSSLAPVDSFLFRRRRAVLAGFAAAGSLALLAMPFLTFDANPLHLRSQTTESMATLLDLAKDPDTSPNVIDVPAPSLAAANVLSARLDALPEVDHVLDLSSFIPDRQPQKLALIADARALLDTTLNPFVSKPPPTDREILTSIADAKLALRNTAAEAVTPAAAAARRLADVLGKLEQTSPGLRASAQTALTRGLETTLDQMRQALQATPVSLQSLPEDLVRNWVGPDGQARLQVFPAGNSNNDAVLARFSEAVQRIAPHATGSPISTRESGRTIVDAFVEAGILSFLAMAVLLAVALRRIHDVFLTLVPLVLAGLLTFGSSVALGLRLNFANIIVLPLLFGIGAAFNVYFIVAWRQGQRNLLQSSLTRAVLFSALTTATGFGTLWLSNHPGTASMGELLMISIGWVLATTLFFVPALLSTMSRH